MDSQKYFSVTEESCGCYYDVNISRGKGGAGVIPHLIFQSRKKETKIAVYMSHEAVWVDKDKEKLKSVSQMQK